MTTLDLPRISDSLQELIDLRLDTLDRTLIGRMPRQERLNIVSEVESQIFELLSQRAADEPGRDDVLAVLGQLDPPEAYVPEDSLERSATPRQRPTRPAPTTPVSSARFARAAGILGISALCLVVVAPLVIVAASLTESIVLAMVAMLLFTLVMFAGGVLAIVFSICARLRGLWAVTGMVTGALAVLLSLCGGLLLLLEFAS
jgi:hypothetical protein